MSYRNIRPSFGESSGSGQKYEEGNHEGGRSPPDPRRKQNDATKHRKAPESVTRNACLNCKKARAKCDGKTPCKRCATRAEAHECIYEIHLKHAKEDLVKQIKELQAKDALSQHILQALSSKTKVDEVLEMLRKGDSQEAIVKSLGKLTQDGTASSATSSPTMSFFEIERSARSPSNGVGTWTVVTNDRSVLDHLFQLYFAWVHPVHTFFHEGQFVHSFHNASGGDDGYCSAVLVNAVCAMACHLHQTLESDTTNFRDLAVEFANAARELMSIEDIKLTTIQAFAVMTLVEVTRGNTLLATSYLDIAVRGLSGIDSDTRNSAPNVWKSTILGVQGLNVELAQVTFRVPHDINIAYVRESSADEERLDMTRWHMYTTPSGLISSWPSIQATTAKQKAKLIAIIYEITSTVHSDRVPPIPAQAIHEFYRRLVSWREEFSEVLEDMEVDNKGYGLPHILSLLVLYSCAVVQLLQPALTLDEFPVHLVEDIIWDHAQRGFSLIEDQYQSQFPLRCQSVLQMYSLLHFADVIARFFPGGIDGHSTDGPQAIKIGIDMLDESANNVPAVKIMQEMLRRTAKSCSIRLITIEAFAGKRYILDDFVRACTRPTFRQPLAEIADRYAPTFAHDWHVRDGTHSSRSPWSRHSPNTPTGTGTSTTGLMQIRNLLN